MRPAAILLAALLPACATQSEPLPRPAAGYDAILVRQAFRGPNGGFGEFDFPAGTMFVADRAVKGEPVFCGAIYLQDMLGALPVRTCAAFDGERLQLHTQNRVRGQPFPIPPGAIERVLVR